jgi:uncharacterized protein YaiE (UPF0345 family)
LSCIPYTPGTGQRIHAGSGHHGAGDLKSTVLHDRPVPAVSPFFPQHTMTTEKIDNISVTTQANVYFDGKCVSHGITFADGTKKSVGVVLPSTLTFNTGAPEIMECVAGACEYKLAGSEAWVKSSPGEKFSVPGNSSFDIRVTEAYHYICHFG